MEYFSTIRDLQQGQVTIREVPLRKTDDKVDVVRSLLNELLAHLGERFQMTVAFWTSAFTSCGLPHSGYRVLIFSVLTRPDDAGLGDKSKQILNLNEVWFRSKEGTKEKSLVVGKIKSLHFTYNSTTREHITSTCLFGADGTIYWSRLARTNLGRKFKHGQRLDRQWQAKTAAKDVCLEIKG